jgi:hypothetical protein
MLSSADLATALSKLSQTQQDATATAIAQVASDTVHGTTLADRLASASTSNYMISRMFRIINNTIGHIVNQIILDMRAQGPLASMVMNPLPTFHTAIRVAPFTSDTFGRRIHNVLQSRASPDFPPPLGEEVAIYVWNQLKEHIITNLQTRIESSVLLSRTFPEAIKHAFSTISDIARRTLNIWVHSTITTAMEMDTPLSHTTVRGDGVAFLFGATYEYNSNESEFNRMSATIGHYIAQHLHTDSDVVSAWQRLWTPVSIQAATALESVSADRPHSIAMRYTVSYADRSNIANVFLLSELMYMMHSDYSASLRDENLHTRLKTVIDLLRTHAFIHTIRVTRDIQEDEESALHGVAMYPSMSQEQMAEFSGWPTVCARVRKALRDREHVENLLNQMRGAIALGPENLPTVRVEPESTDTLMVEEWQQNELAVALNGERRPEYLVRVADYERMLIHGTAENPFDRRDVQTVEVVRIIVE